ncbi:unnamed protein product [Staurois parvus]|uniref:Transposase n=1 Tax=Staurois parvus TaxID=386267 RepID=A0ABN9AFG7_9NEOB|nr:unnamed protein product [Staurois parvus]
MRSRKIFLQIDDFKTVWCRKGEEYQEKCMVPTVKHCDGSVLLWACSAAGVGELHFIDGIMTSQMYCSMLKEKFSIMKMTQNTHLRPLLHF